MVTPTEGAQGVALARSALSAAVSGTAPRDPAAPFRTIALPPVFDQPRGVFVTLKRHPSGELRGCIGFPLPVFPLRVAIPRAAVAAAVEDPRFPAVTAAELPRVTVELSVLTVPEPLPGATPSERLASVRVGVDGLIVDADGASGLLLPQVAAEERWSAQQLLEGTCRKAGLRVDAWRRPEVRIRRFQGELFAEPAPGAPAESLSP